MIEHKLTQLRSTDTNPKRFRELIGEISTLLAYDATRDLVTEPTTVKTPMGNSEGQVLIDNVGLVPILRAGLGMVESIWKLLPSAEVWHIGLYRDEQTLLPVEYYNKLPDTPRVQVCLVLDPMLATGGSAVATIRILKDWGVKRIKYMGIIAAPEGINQLHAQHPNVPIHIGAIDNRLNNIGFIVPGLGDAGDRQFGTG